MLPSLSQVVSENAVGQQEEQMTDIAYSRCGFSPKEAVSTTITAMSKMALKVMREWRRRYRSRQELALYSYHERNDFSFAVDVDAEISKPFWRQ
jgi:uncharacterized protein YjiS (DUF1127 family)